MKAFFVYVGTANEVPHQDDNARNNSLVQEKREQLNVSTCPENDYRSIELHRIYNLREVKQKN